MDQGVERKTSSGLHPFCKLKRLFHASTRGAFLLLFSLILLPHQPPAEAQPAGQKVIKGSQVQNTGTPPSISQASTHTLYEQLFKTKEDTDHDLFVVVRTARGIRLSENIHLRQIEGRYFADLTWMAELLGGKLTWDGQKLSGWFGNPDHEIKFDSSTSRLTIRDTVNDLQSRDIFVEDGVLFADLDLISIILRVKFEIKVANLGLVVGGRPTPAECAILRNRARRGLGKRKTASADKDSHIVSTYENTGRGRVDIVTSGAYHSSFKSSHTRQRMRKSVRVFSTAHFDFANSRMKIIATGDNTRSLRDFRISSHRKQYDETSHYSILELGDITGFAAVNANRAGRGRGAKITNKPFLIPDVIGEEAITGDAPPGWEVELYRGDTLIDFAMTDSSGRFSFAPASLRSGLNIFTIKLFGPEGQVETRQKKVLANHGVPAKGRIRYQLSALEARRTLSGVHERTRCSFSRYCERDTIGQSVVGNFTYAITNQTALNASLSQAPDKSGYGRFHSIGILSNNGGRQWKFDATTASGTANGHAFRGYSRLLFGRLSGSVTHSEFQDFTGDVARKNNYFLRRKSKLYLAFPSVTIGADKSAIRLNNSASLSADRGERGQQSQQLALRHSLSAGRLRASLSLSGTKLNQGRHRHSWRGSFSLIRYVGRDELFAKAFFKMQPDNKVTRVSVGRRFRFRPEHVATAEIEHDNDISRDTRLKLGLTAERSHYRLGLATDISMEGQHKVSFTLASSLVAPADRHTPPALVNSRDASGSALIVHSFLDSNKNGMKDLGERELVETQVNIKPPPLRTTRTIEGTTIYEGLPADRVIKVTVDPRSQEHPFLSTQQTEYSLVLRDGAVKTLEAPAQSAGEIAGRLMLRSFDENGQAVDTPLSTVPITLFDSTGKLIASTQPIYDGSFVASKIPLGRITVKPSQKHIDALGMTDITVPENRTVTLSNDRIWADDVVLLVTRD